MQLKKIIPTILLGLFPLLTSFKSQAAERIIFSYPPWGDFNIYVEDLKVLAETNVISPRLEYLTNQLTAEELKQLQSVLSHKIEFNPTATYHFTHSYEGERILNYFGEALKSDRDRNGFLALRAAINQAAQNSEGLTLLNVFQKFPLDNIYLDLSLVIREFTQARKLVKQRESIIANLIENNSLEIKQENQKNLDKIELSKDYSWKKLTLKTQNSQRTQATPFDVYLPAINQPAPIIVISHGLASNRITFAYLAKHLASQGFVVVLPEHIGTSFTRFERFLSGTENFPDAQELIKQPLDIKYILDSLELAVKINPQLQDKIDLQKVGIIGHSVGAYTALALGGARIDWKNLAAECNDNYQENILLNPAILIQCSLNQVPIQDYQIIDYRVKAVLAISPFTSKIFGESGMSKLQVPTMIISGTKDFITPAVPEQIYPFTWLKTPNKYLVLVQPANHFSFLEKSIGILPVPDSIVGLDPALAYPSIKALTTDFFNGYLLEEKASLQRLNQDYLATFNNKDIALFLIKSLNLEAFRSIK